MSDETEEWRELYRDRQGALLKASLARSTTDLDLTPDRQTNLLIAAGRVLNREGEDELDHPLESFTLIRKGEEGQDRFKVVTDEEVVFEALLGEDDTRFLRYIPGRWEDYLKEWAKEPEELEARIQEMKREAEEIAAESVKTPDDEMCNNTESK